MVISPVRRGEGGRWGKRGRNQGHTRLLVSEEATSHPSHLVLLTPTPSLVVRLTENDSIDEDGKEKKRRRKMEGLTKLASSESIAGVDLGLIELLPQSLVLLLQ